MSNVSFEVLSPPVRHDYASSDSMVIVEKVLWKDSWAFSICRDKDGQRDSDDSLFYVYKHWAVFNQFAIIGRYPTIELARDGATVSLIEFEGFLRAMWFRPRGVKTR